MSIVKPFSERRGLVFRKLYVVKMGQFWQFQRESTQNICEIASVMQKTYEIKIPHVSRLKTQMRCETVTQIFQK